MKPILLCHPDPSAAAPLQEALARGGHGVVTSTTAGECLAGIPQHSPALLILDSGLGFEVLERREGPARRIPVALLARALPEQDVYRYWELGVDTFQSANEAAIPELLIKIDRLLASEAGDP